MGAILARPLHGFLRLLERLDGIVEVFREKVHKAKTGWTVYGRPCKRRPSLVEVACHLELNETYTQELLERLKFQAPVFALVDGSMSFKLQTAIHTRVRHRLPVQHAVASAHFVGAATMGGA